jgi:hypothetical protein
VASRTELTVDVVTETVERPVSTTPVTTACVTAVAVSVVRVTADVTAVVVVRTDESAS